MRFKPDTPAAMAAGKHVPIDKPFPASLEDARG
jgi:predicted dehydrogenase